MNSARVVPKFAAQLAARLQEGLRLDVADGAADLDQRHVEALGAGEDATLDLVGDVRDHLHGAAEVVAAPLAPQHLLVHLAGGEIVAAGHARAHEALVVPEVEVGLRAVVGDVHLAVLERAHGARIDVDVGVELEQRDAQAARLEDGSQGRRREPLAQRGNHTTRDEYQARHA
jgi:hypothetical protein